MMLWFLAPPEGAFTGLSMPAVLISFGLRLLGKTE
jgi:hypothetical protein